MLGKIKCRMALILLRRSGKVPPREKKMLFEVTPERWGVSQVKGWGRVIQAEGTAWTKTWKREKAWHTRQKRSLWPGGQYSYSMVKWGTRLAQDVWRGGRQVGPGHTGACNHGKKFASTLTKGNGKSVTADYKQGNSKGLHHLKKITPPMV